MDKFADFCIFTGEWEQESIESNDWVDLLEAIEEHHIMSQEECSSLKSRFMDLVNTSAIPEVRSVIEARILKRGSSEEELDNIVDNLSSGRIWNDDRFLYDPSDGLVWDMSNGDKRAMNFGEVWWNLISAIQNLQLLSQNGRVRK